MQVNTPSITPTSRSWFLLALNQEGVSHLVSVRMCVLTLWDFNAFYIMNVMEIGRAHV